MEGQPFDDIGPAGIVTAVMHTEQIAKALLKLCGNSTMRKVMGGMDSIVFHEITERQIYS